jgi:hypothetical protein
MKNSINNNDNNLTTLIKLKKLQSLIKKESALKELCKWNDCLFIILYIIVIDTKNRIINQITEECKNFYIKKLEVSNLISSKFNKINKK